MSNFYAVCHKLCWLYDLIQVLQAWNDAKKTYVFYVPIHIYLQVGYQQTRMLNLLKIFFEFCTVTASA